MGLYFRIPLPGPFAYATRIGGSHQSKYERAPGDYSKRELRHQREAEAKAAKKWAKKPGELQGAVSRAWVAEDGQVIAAIYARAGVEGRLSDRIFVTEIELPEVEARGLIFPDALLTIYVDQRTLQPTGVIEPGSSWLNDAWNALHVVDGSEVVTGTPIADQISAEYDRQQEAAERAEVEARQAADQEAQQQVEARKSVSFGGTS